MDIKKSFIIMLLTTSLVSVPLISEGRAGEQGGVGGSYRSPSINYPGGGPYQVPRYQAPNYPTSPPSYGAPIPSSPNVGYEKGSSSGGSFFSGVLTGAFSTWLYHKLFPTQQPSATPTTTPGASSGASTLEQNPLDILFGKSPGTTGSSPAAIPQQTETRSGGGWLFNIILILALFYLIRRFLKRRSNIDKNVQYRSTDTNTSNQSDNILKTLEDNLGRKTGALGTLGGAEKVNLGLADSSAFASLLVAVQSAWSRNHLDELQRLTTSDMNNYLTSVLNENKKDGVTNHVEQVVVLNQQVQDAWQQDNATYARVALTWKALDYTTKGLEGDSETVVDGDNRIPSSVTEVWTFVRYPNSPWLLAGIDQPA